MIYIILLFKGKGQHAPPFAVRAAPIQYFLLNAVNNQMLIAAWKAS